MKHSGLFIGNISYDTTDFQLKEFLNQFGIVVSAMIVPFKGIGIATALNYVEAEKIISLGNNQELNNRNIRISYSKSKIERHKTRLIR